MMVRFYEKEFPDVGEVVMATVCSIADTGAYATLLEYNNIQGMSIWSEITRRRVRSTAKLLRVGKKEAMAVLRVGANGDIDLSKRRLTPKEVIECEERYNKACAVRKILLHVARDLDEDSDLLYQRIAWPAYKNTHCYDMFKRSIDDESVLEELDIEPHVLQSLKTQICRHIVPGPFKLHAAIELTCFKYAGIEAIRSALQAAEKLCSEDMPIRARLIASPLYEITASASNAQKGIENMRDYIERVREHIIASNGMMATITSPKICAETESVSTQ